MKHSLGMQSISGSGKSSEKIKGLKGAISVSFEQLTAARQVNTRISLMLFFILFGLEIDVKI